MTSFSLPLVITAAVASVAVAAVFGFRHIPCCGNKCPAPASEANQAAIDIKLVANCVEARSASVFAGACHYNGELMTQGNELMLAISVESGSSQGVDLTGVCAAELVGSDKNLKLDGARRSVVYVSKNASKAQQVSIVSLLKERSHDGLGEIVAIEAAPLTVLATGEKFSVEIPERISLHGAAMADRACCKMPNLVWYEPLVPLKNRVVGYTEVWRVKEPRLAMDFQRAEENSTFLGRLSFFEGGCAAESSAAQ